MAQPVAETNALSISLALLSLWYATSVVGQGEERRCLRPFREISMLGTVLSFGVGLAAFDVFACSTWARCLRYSGGEEPKSPPRRIGVCRIS